MNRKPLILIGFIRKEGSSRVIFDQPNGHSTVFNILLDSIPENVLTKAEPVYFVGFAESHFIFIYGDPLEPTFMSTGGLRGGLVKGIIKAIRPSDGSLLLRWLKEAKNKTRSRG